MKPLKPLLTLSLNAKKLSFPDAFILFNWNIELLSAERWERRAQHHVGPQPLHPTVGEAAARLLGVGDVVQAEPQAVPLRARVGVAQWGQELKESHSAFVHLSVRSVLTCL